MDYKPKALDQEVLKQFPFKVIQDRFVFFSDPALLERLLEGIG